MMKTNLRSLLIQQHMMAIATSKSIARISHSINAEPQAIITQSRTRQTIGYAYYIGNCAGRLYIMDDYGDTFHMYGLAYQLKGCKEVL
jgi:hypothetical protein